MSKELIGRIDCPCCKCKDGMRVTTDRNGEPFGFCDALCGVQMRVGGAPHRVAAFYKAHPGLQQKPVTGTVPETVADTDQKQEPIQQPAQEVRRGIGRPS